MSSFLMPCSSVPRFLAVLHRVEDNADPGPDPCPGDQLEVPVVAVHDPFGDGKPEAGPTGLLGT